MGLFSKFGSNKRRASNGGAPAFDYRSFPNGDARQNAIDDYQVITTSQSGLAGIMPLYGMSAAETPSGFDYLTGIQSLGGTPAPVSIPQPLIDQPQFAQTYLSEQG